MHAHIYSYRGNVVDNRHTASVAIVNPSGKLVAYAGDPHLAAHLRSSSKPFQAQALFLSGAAQYFQLSPKQIAISCASHMGAARHVEVIAGYLQRIGLSPEHLACGAHIPIDREMAQVLYKAGEEPSVLHSNCSGKHCGMLATSLALGTTPHGYEQPDHPVQQLNFQTFRDLSGEQEITYGIDGCSVPAFVLPLAAAARMFAQLAQPAAAPKKYQHGLETAYQAMRAHPDMVSGPGGMDTVLMGQLPNFACKGGADGYHGLSLCESKYGPLGITLKVESGSSEAHDPLVIAVLEQLGIISPDEPNPWRKPLIRNVRKLEVGHYEAKLELTWV